MSYQPYKPPRKRCRESSTSEREPTPAATARELATRLDAFLDILELLLEEYIPEDSEEDTLEEDQSKPS